MNAVFQLDLQRTEGVLLVRFKENQLDFIHCDEAFEELNAIVAQEQPRMLVLNLRRVSHLHSVSIGRLVFLNQLVKTHGGEMRLCSLAVQPKEALALTRVERVLNIFASEQVALCELN